MCLFLLKYEKLYGSWVFQAHNTLKKTEVPESLHEGRVAVDEIKDPNLPQDDQKLSFMAYNIWQPKRIGIYWNSVWHSLYGIQKGFGAVAKSIFGSRSIEESASVHPKASTSNEDDLAEFPEEKPIPAPETAPVPAPPPLPAPAPTPALSPDKKALIPSHSQLGNSEPARSLSGIGLIIKFRQRKNSGYGYLRDNQTNEVAKFQPGVVKGAAINDLQHLQQQKRQFEFKAMLRSDFKENTPQIYKWRVIEMWPLEQKMPRDLKLSADVQAGNPSKLGHSELSSSNAHLLPPDKKAEATLLDKAILLKKEKDTCTKSINIRTAKKSVAVKPDFPKIVKNAKVHSIEFNVPFTLIDLALVGHAANINQARAIPGVLDISTQISTNNSNLCVLKVSANSSDAAGEVSTFLFLNQANSLI